MDVRAAVAEAGSSSFSLELVELDLPRDDEILIRIVAVGLCHTDLVALEGRLPIALPAVLGHEGAGVVEQIGKDVRTVAPGDHVLLSMRSCQRCARCRAEDPSYCDYGADLNFAGVRVDGSTSIRRHGEPISSNFFGQSSFASYALAFEDNVVRIDPALPLDVLAPLGCGVQTGVGAVLRSLACPPGSTLLVTGGGSVGLSAVMGGAIAGCGAVIVSDPVPERRALALELGATAVIDPTVDDLQVAVRSVAPGGVDFALDTTGNRLVATAALSSLRRRGVLGLVGVPHSHDAATPGAARQVLLGGLTIRGIVEGDSDPSTFIPQLVGFYKDGRLPLEKLVSVYPFDQINVAVEDQLSGRVVKAVLAM